MATLFRCHLRIQAGGGLPSTKRIWYLLQGGGASYVQEIFIERAACEANGHAFHAVLHWGATGPAPHWYGHQRHMGRLWVAMALSEMLMDSLRASPYYRLAQSYAFEAHRFVLVPTVR